VTKKFFSSLHRSKLHSRACQEGLDEEQMYNSTLSLTSPLDVVGGKRHALADLPRKRDHVPTVQEAGWVPGMV